MMLIRFLFEHFPFLEICSKKLMGHGRLRYYLKKKALHVASKKQRPTLEAKEQVFNALNRLDINQGDILILHSSMDELALVGIDAVELIKYFVARLGDNGTLVIPTFPLYSPNATSSTPLVYDKNRTLCWTGLLPNIFLCFPNVMRSEFPYNTLAAVGKHAGEMMRNNLEDMKAYGPHSAWVYCTNHHAKVLLLGTPAFHTMTISHIPEDLMGDKWPIKNFHIEKNFILKTPEGDKQFTALIRDEKWATYLKSYQRTRMLRKKGLLYETIFVGIYVGFVKDSKAVVDFLTERALRKKTMYYVPKRFIK